MRIRRRDRPLVSLLGAAGIVFGCSRLTEVDWALVQAPADGSAGSSMGAAAGSPEAGQPSNTGGGEAGETNGGAPAGGEADSAEPYGGTATTGGTGTGGNAGSSVGGVGGNAGSTGVAGTAGTAGTAGSGGGGAGGMGGDQLPPCTPTTGPITDALVLFPSPAKPTAARGGRTGLDADCEAERTRLALPQTKSHAFITIATDDFLGNWVAQTDRQFSEIPITKHVVGPTGIEIAASLTDLMEGTVERSLTCAQVLPQDALYWLSGNSQVGTAVAAGSAVNFYGQFSQPLDDCTGWTLGDHDPVTHARPGSAVYADQRLLCAAQTSIQITYLYIQCDTTSTAPALCLAYTP